MSEEITNTRVGRRQYMVIYSQADKETFPTRQSFGTMLRAAFNKGTSKVNVQYWACCEEKHSDGGIHYHCCLKLTVIKKWLGVKQDIQKQQGVVVNFSDKHNNYISAYRYVTKEDENVYHSPGHPDLSSASSPRTKACQMAYRQKQKSRREQPETSGSSARKHARLDNLQVSEFIVKHNIHSNLELFNFAEQRKEAGEMDLAKYLLARNVKQVDELIGKTWLLKTAGGKLARENTSRIDLIKEAAQKDCAVPDCLWLASAMEVLQFSNINAIDFANHLYDSLDKGRGKFRNIILVGESNCAKTFMFKPMAKIFGDSLFENPAHDK